MFIYLCMGVCHHVYNFIHCSGATGLDKDGVSKGGDRKRSGAHKGDTSPPRKSLRKPKEDSSDGKADDKLEKLTGSKQTPGSEGSLSILFIS